MRSLALTLMVTTAPVFAQVPFSSPSTLSLDPDEVVLATGAVTIGMLSMIGLAGLVTDRDDVNMTYAILAAETGYMLGAGLGVHLAGLATQIEGDSRRGMTGALIGGAIGMGVTGGLLLSTEDEVGQYIAVAVGGSLVFLLSTAMAVNGYRVVPAPLAVRPDGSGIGLGLALRATF